MLNRSDQIKVGIAVLGVSLIFYSIAKNRGQDGSIMQIDQQPNQNDSFQSVEDAKSLAEGLGGGSTDQLNEDSNEYEGLDELNPTLAFSKQLNQFKTEVGLEFSFPMTQNSIKLEFDEQTVGMFSELEEGGGSGIVASTINPSPEQIAKFIEEEKGNIPFLAGEKGFSWSKPQVLPQVPGSGLKEAKIWSSPASDGTELWVSVVSREDGQGSYLLMMKNSASFFDQQEGYLEQIYNELKAQPVSKPQ